MESTMKWIRRICFGGTCLLNAARSADAADPDRVLLLHSFGPRLLTLEHDHAAVPRSARKLAPIRLTSTKPPFRRNGSAKIPPGRKAIHRLSKHASARS